MFLTSQRMISLFWVLFHNHILGLLVNSIESYIFTMRIKNTDREASAMGWFIDAFKRFCLPEQTKKQNFSFQQLYLIFPPKNRSLST